MCNIAVVADGHYYRTDDGKVYSRGVYGYGFFARYLASFDQVFAFVRIQNVQQLPPKVKLVSGDRVDFIEIPSFRGPVQYAKNYVKVLKAVKEGLKQCDCVMLRAPSATSQIVYKVLKKTNIPWAMEVVVDPWEYFAPHTVESRLRPIFRITWTYSLKKMCRECKAVSYVTGQYLQEHYPCRFLLTHEPDTCTESYSSVDIADGSIAKARCYIKRNGTFHVVHVAANVEGEGKGHLVLLNVIKQVISRGYDVDVTFIGEGSMLERFRQISRELGIAQRAHFLGRLPGVEAVRAELKKADLFVFPTRAEGLPRVLIEAMAEGLPCISTPVCGIPEILDPGWMFQFDDVDGFADKIISCMEDPAILTRQSEKNIEKAYAFEHHCLMEKRKRFYDHLKGKCI